MAFVPQHTTRYPMSQGIIIVSVISTAIIFAFLIVRFYLLRHPTSESLDHVDAPMPLAAMPRTQTARLSNIMGRSTPHPVIDPDNPITIHVMTNTEVETDEH